MGVTVVLASASPARLETLRRAGLDPVVEVSGVDETTVTDADPAGLALRLAELKGRAVVDRQATAARGERVLVVACDSLLELSGEVHGKPASAAEAIERLTSMSGASGVLHTGHFLADVGSGRSLSRQAATVVHFAQLSAAEIEAYVSTGEPLAVAGGFTIDGLGGAFVRGVEGDPHTVVGISLPLLRRMFAELGVGWTDLWRRSPSPDSSG